MAFVCIAVSSMVVVGVVAVLLVWMFTVSVRLMVIMAFSMVIALLNFFMTTFLVGLVTLFFFIPVVVIVAFFIIRVITVIRTPLVILLALVVLWFVSVFLSRLVFPIIGKRYTCAAKDNKDNNIEEVGHSHWLSPRNFEMSKKLINSIRIDRFYNM